MAWKEGYTRSVGAKSGAESYAIAGALILALWPFIGLNGVCFVWTGLFIAQVILMAPIDRRIMMTTCLSQKFGPMKMRNACIGFAECVRPGGKPTDDHCLNLYHYPAWVTSAMASVTCLYVLSVGPVLAAVRVMYPEHQEGVNRNDRQKLWWFLVQHPLAIQGEGPSNGDGLAAMGGSASIIYPVTKKGLERGPTDKPYWKEEGKPRLRDMFHDKLFVHRFFKEHGASCPILVAEVFKHARREIFLEPDKAPKQLCWKPRYSTMGLGVEKFQGWEEVDQEGWAPSTVPYIIEELIVSTEYTDASEWYRMTTIWDYEEKEPKSGYIWRTRNSKGDTRVQTDIIGGAYLVTSEHEPFVGPKAKGTVYDPRTKKQEKIDKKVDKALSKAINLMKKMHKTLGIELFTIGWDVMVREDEPVFIEFNINNGFFLADHSVAEAEQMVTFYAKQFNGRIDKQLINFNPGD